MKAGATASRDVAARPTRLRQPQPPRRRSCRIRPSPSRRTSRARVSRLKTAIPKPARRREPHPADRSGLPQATATAPGRPFSIPGRPPESHSHPSSWVLERTVGFCRRASVRALSAYLQTRPWQVNGAPCVDAPPYASALERFRHVIGCGHVSGLYMRRFTCRWRS